MKSKYLIIITIVVIAVGGYLYISSSGSSSDNIKYVTDEVIIGDISSTVTANGKVKPREKVEIRTNVDGTVQEIYVEINSKVQKGDLLATLDDTLYRTRLNEAESKLNKAENLLEQKKKLLKSDKVLYSKELISNQEYQDSVSQYKAALASYDEAKASIEIARINYESTKIRSSIDGMVLDRNINVGQAVTTENNSVPLFIIASPLDKMHLVSDVSESDISEVELGQNVKFVVSAYPDTVFEGEVIEISNNPKTENNLVTYEVISQIENPDLRLKPGMTAEVDIITSVKNNVMKVPTSALRVVIPGTDKSATNIRKNNGMQSLWIKNNNDNIKRIEIRTGISDDTYTEILKGDLSPGEKVITGFSTTPGSDSESLITLPQPKRF